LGSVVSMLGLGGGAGGTGFSGPQAAPISNPVTQDQINAAMTGTNQSMAGQQSLLGALQAQNGLGNQTNVYNQMQGVANGTGPNPAQAMLNQSTGQNVANQAALMAGQRGAGANAGLLARQAAMQGANTQQQAAGQGAVMQANQSLNALGQLGGMAGNMAANQIGQTNANTQAQQANQAQLLGNAQAFNNAQVSNQSSINAANAGMAGAKMGQMGSAIGGAMSGLAAGAMMGAAAAEGGAVDRLPKMANGGEAFAGPSSRFGQFISSQPGIGSPSMTSVPDLTNAQGDAALSQGMKDLGKALAKPGAPTASGEVDSSQPIQSTNPLSSTPSAQDVSNAMQTSPGIAPEEFAKGGKVPAMVSPGEQYLPPKDVKKVVKDGKNPLSVGERIPGKPKYKGNDYRNDVIPKTLTSGGIVIPNEIMQSKNPHFESMKFVHATIAKNRKGLPKK
jgi:hypothetical protein